MKKISIITPCLNEEKNILRCYEEVKKIFKELELEYEHIIADNNSTDNTRKILREITSKDKNVKAIFHTNNFDPFKSQFNAMKYATGDAVLVSLAADLQDPVYMIKNFIEYWKKGYMVVTGKRENRTDNFFKKFFRTIYYKMFKLISNSSLEENIGEFTLIDKKVHKIIINIDDHYPYLRGLIHYLNFKTKIILYKHEKREFGTSNYSIFSHIPQALNAFVSFSTIPLRFFLILGFLISSLSILYSIYLLYASVALESGAPPGIKTLLVVVFLFFGINFISLGVIGEFLISINNQVRKKPLVVEEEKINL